MGFRPPHDEVPSTNSGQAFCFGKRTQTIFASARPPASAGAGSTGSFASAPNPSTLPGTGQDGCATRGVYPESCRRTQTVLARGVDAGLRLRRSRRDCLVISNGVRNLSQGKAEISLTGRNDKRRMKGDSWTDQLCFLLMLVSEEPEIFGVRLGQAVEGKW